MQLIISPWSRAAENNALEEFLLNERPARDVLLLYVNSPAVVVGRHQCIEAEVDTAYCAAHQIEVVRRLSGGGTVYHDEGNVNFAYIVNRGDLPALDRDFTAPVVRALRTLGAPVEAGPRRELLCGGLKVSGTACHVSRDRVLFHGTLLHRADLTRLRLALQGDPTRRGKAVASVPSRVANLSEWTGPDELTISFLARLAEILRRENDLEPAGLTEKEIENILGKLRKS